MSAANVLKFIKEKEAEESPLGPIKVILTSSNIDGIIDWIAFDYVLGGMKMDRRKVKKLTRMVKKMDY